MAVGDLVTAFQHYEFNGLLLGHGTDYIVTKVDGLLGKSDVKTTDIDRQDAWGEFPGRDMYKGRKIVFTIEVINDINPIEQNMASLEAAWAIPDISPPASPYQLVFYRNWPTAGKRFYWGKPGRLAVPSDSDYAMGNAHVIAEIKANDPRKYSLIESSDLYTIPNTGSTFSGFSTNSGDTAMAPILDIVGPFTNPIIQNVTDAGKAFKMSIAGLANDLLEIDMRQRTVTLNGSDVGHNMMLDSNWWKLRPGANQIIYSRSGAGASSTMTLRRRNAWS